MGLVCLRNRKTSSVARMEWLMGREVGVKIIGVLGSQIMQGLVGYYKDFGFHSE